MGNTKTRGRRHQEKQKKDEFEPSSNVVKEHTQVEEPAYTDDSGNKENQPQMFFGVLDREELEYFKQAESTLQLDAFETPEEKFQFVTSIIEEAKGKELKLVTSQITSKLMERIILECDEAQLKNIFQSFNGAFFGSSCHKYASHVLETLFVRSAALLERELLTPSFDSDEKDGPHVTMENMFLFMLNELKPHLKMMVNHQYGSHVLRLLILILSSKTLPNSTKTNSTLRSKKSKIARKMIDIKDNDDFNKVYQTPESFKSELRDIITTLYKSFTNGAESRSDVSQQWSPSSENIV